MVRHDCQYCLYRGPVVYGRSQRRHRSCTFSETSAYRLDGIVGNRWCSIWKDRFPDMKWVSWLPVKLAEPSICRRYHSACVSLSRSSSVNLSAPSGKWPQKMTALDQRLRMTLAVALAVGVVFQLRPDRAGNQT